MTTTTTMKERVPLRALLLPPRMATPTTTKKNKRLFQWLVVWISFAIILGLTVRALIRSVSLTMTTTTTTTTMRNNGEDWIQPEIIMLRATKITDHNNAAVSSHYDSHVSAAAVAEKRVPNTKSSSSSSSIPSNNKKVKQQQQQPPQQYSTNWNSTGSKTPLGNHPHAGARYPDGTYGFVADVTAVRRHYLESYHRHLTAMQANPNLVRSDIHSLYTFLPMSKTDMLYKNKQPTNKTTYQYVCDTTAGKGFEQRRGYSLMMERIQVNAPEPLPWKIPDTLLFRVDTKPVPPPPPPPEKERSRRSRILCVVYTYHGGRYRLEGITATWGWRCDGFFAASTLTQFDPTKLGFGMVDVPHRGKESYNNMWQKTRSLIGYIYDNYLHHFEYFYIVGDDTHLIVENLRNYLDTVERDHNITTQPPSGRGGTQQRNNHDTYPLYLGNAVPLAFKGKTDAYAGGGSGYVLNRAAIRRYMEHKKGCASHMIISAEDRYMGQCMKWSNVTLLNTHDKQERIRFHGLDPASLSVNNYKNSYFDYVRRYQKLHNLTQARGRNVVSTQSVAMHVFKKPEIMKRIHAILYRSCPAGTKLGDAQIAFDQQTNHITTSIRELQLIEQNLTQQQQEHRQG